MSSIKEVRHLKIPLQDILSATENFAPENIIAQGGFGTVFRGESEQYGTIAIKRLDPKRGQGKHEFMMEISTLSFYKHENLVSLLGFCDEKGEKILVYKHESNGSLDKHISRKDLTWMQRLWICLGAALGLRYLHDDVGPQHRVLHRDVKSSNILLDKYWKAKISDFGLSKIGPANVQFTLLISNACGTIGYIDPQYFDGGILTQKSDVYSFGVVLFEVLCGRLAFDKDDKDESHSLSRLAQNHYENKTLDEIIDSNLLKQIDSASLHTFSSIAYQCLKTRREERPTMALVVEKLMEALVHQTSSTFSNQSSKRHHVQSIASSSSKPWKHDVYLSFQKEDTHNTFVSHLYSSLERQGIITYKDHKKLHLGESIDTSLPKAIEGSQIAVIVLSKNYANSSWCLDELVHIMKCKEEREQMVMLILYHVDPLEVREQNQKLGEVFADYEQENSNKVDSWRKALVNVADLVDSREVRKQKQKLEEVFAENGNKVETWRYAPENVAGPVDSSEVLRKQNQKHGKVFFYYEHENNNEVDSGRKAAEYVPDLADGELHGNDAKFIEKVVDLILAKLLTSRAKAWLI